MSEPDALIELLKVPGVHSGTELGNKLGVSRVAIKKRIDRLALTGFPVESVSNRGYKLKEDTELLSSTSISNLVSFEDTNQRLNLQVFQTLDSTNIFVANARKDLNEVCVAITESQPMGQGRRGRSWVSSPYQNLMLSVGYVYPSWPENPSAISLAFSVAVHRALANLGAGEVKLKWPNDLFAQDSKLGGLLVSASGEAGGELGLVLGVGINMSVGKDLLSEIDQPAIDLDSLSGLKKKISRNQLAAEIINNTADMLGIYQQTGFKPFADYWNEHALFVGDEVRLFDTQLGGSQRSDGQQQQEFVGTLEGVDEFGELCLRDKNGKISRFNKSELSLRAI